MNWYWVAGVGMLLSLSVGVTAVVLQSFYFLQYTIIDVMAIIGFMIFTSTLVSLILTRLGSAVKRVLARSQWAEMLGIVTFRGVPVPSCDHAECLAACTCLDAGAGRSLVLMSSPRQQQRQQQRLVGAPVGCLRIVEAGEASAAVGGAVGRTAVGVGGCQQPSPTPPASTSGGFFCPDNSGDMLTIFEDYAQYPPQPRRLFDTHRISPTTSPENVNIVASAAIAPPVSSSSRSSTRPAAAVESDAASTHRTLGHHPVQTTMNIALGCNDVVIENIGCTNAGDTGTTSNSSSSGSNSNSTSSSSSNGSNTNTSTATTSGSSSGNNTSTGCTGSGAEGNVDSRNDQGERTLVVNGVPADAGTCHHHHHPHYHHHLHHHAGEDGSLCMPSAGDDGGLLYVVRADGSCVHINHLTAVAPTSGVALNAAASANRDDMPEEERKVRDVSSDGSRVNETSVDSGSRGAPAERCCGSQARCCASSVQFVHASLVHNRPPPPPYHTTMPPPYHHHHHHHHLHHHQQPQQQQQQHQQELSASAMLTASGASAGLSGSPSLQSQQPPPPPPSLMLFRRSAGGEAPTVVFEHGEPPPPYSELVPTPPSSSIASNACTNPALHYHLHGYHHYHHHHHHEHCQHGGDVSDGAVNEHGSDNVNNNGCRSGSDSSGGASSDANIGLNNNNGDPCENIVLHNRENNCSSNNNINSNNLRSGIIGASGISEEHSDEDNKRTRGSADEVDSHKAAHVVMASSNAGGLTSDSIESRRTSKTADGMAAQDRNKGVDRAAVSPGIDGSVQTTRTLPSFSIDQHALISEDRQKHQRPLQSLQQQQKGHENFKDVQGALSKSIDGILVSSNVYHHPAAVPSPPPPPSLAMVGILDNAAEPVCRHLPRCLVEESSADLKCHQGCHRVTFSGIEQGEKLCAEQMLDRQTKPRQPARGGAPDTNDERVLGIACAERQQSGLLQCVRQDSIEVVSETCARRLELVGQDDDEPPQIHRHLPHRQQLQLAVQAVTSHLWGSKDSCSEGDNCSGGCSSGGSGTSSRLSSKSSSHDEPDDEDSVGNNSRHSASDVRRKAWSQKKQDKLYANEPPCDAMRKNSGDGGERVSMAVETNPSKLDHTP